MGTSESDRVEEVVIYCLHTNCKQTTMFGQNDWTENIERWWRVKHGLVTSMFGPYCPLHDKQNKPTAA